MTKAVRLCDMCGKQPGDPQPKDDTSTTVSIPNWITLSKPGLSEGDKIQPRGYDLCSELCLQKLVAGEPPLTPDQIDAMQ